LQSRLPTQWHGHYSSTPAFCVYCLPNPPTFLHVHSRQQYKIKALILQQSPLFYCYYPTRQSNVYLVNSSRG